VTKVCAKIHETYQLFQKLKWEKIGQIGYTSIHRHVHNGDSLFTLIFLRKDIRTSRTQQTHTCKKNDTCR